MKMTFIARKEIELNLELYCVENNLINQLDILKKYNY